MTTDSEATRVVSLLPGATETLFALGLGGRVVGVTHECDHPPAARSLPRVTRSVLELEGMDGGAIDAQVSASAAAGRELYEIDAGAILGLRPDLVIAQDICDVCAVPADQVELSLTGVRVLRMHAHRMEDVLAGMEELSRACGANPTPLIEELRRRIDAVAAEARGRPAVRGVFLEWLDPPYASGHWTPDLLRMAGIDDPLARPGRPSVPTSWQAVRQAQPELLLLAPCGFNEERTWAEAERMRSEIESVGARRVVVFDGSAYFNRPGPRLVDSLELLVNAKQGLDRPTGSVATPDAPIIPP